MKTPLETYILIKNVSERKGWIYMDKSERDEIRSLINKRMKVITDGIEMIEEDLRSIKTNITLNYLLIIVLIVTSILILSKP